MTSEPTDGETAVSSGSKSPMLSLRGVSVRFGGLLAVDDVALHVERGERVAVLGPNGAGKTTLFNVIAGDVRPTTGTVTIAGVDCTNAPSRVRPGLGVARTYQRTRLMQGLTVTDNLYLAQLGSSGRRHFSLLPSRRDREFRDRAADVASQVSLDGLRDRLVGELSHGQQRQLEIGMALAADPQLMMLDEPASGLSRGERERLTELLLDLSRTLSLLVIEHDMEVALTVVDRVVMLSNGSVAATGNPKEIRHNPVVQELYLGPADSNSSEGSHV